MDKYIALAFIGCDEAEALIQLEELDCARLARSPFNWWVAASSAAATVGSVPEAAATATIAVAISAAVTVTMPICVIAVIPVSAVSSRTAVAVGTSALIFHHRRREATALGISWKLCWCPKLRAEILRIPKFALAASLAAWATTRIPIMHYNIAFPADKTCQYPHVLAFSKPIARLKTYK